MPTHVHRLILAAFCASAFTFSLIAAPIRVEITRDTWVSAIGQEADFNTGGSARLKLKGVQEFAIVDIDPTPLKGKIITSAELHLKNASKEILHRITVSTLAGEWVEGTSPSYGRQKGSASFNWAMQDEAPWAWPGSDLTAVSLSQGGTIWRFAEATAPDKDGWQTIAVDPAVIGARIAGISHGFVVIDDVGSEYEHNGDQFKWKLFPNHFVCSREQSNAKPYFIVNVDGEAREAAPAPSKIVGRSDELPSGEAWLGVEMPNVPQSARAIGFVARIAGSGPFAYESAKPVPQYLMAAPHPRERLTWIRLRDMDLKPGGNYQIGVSSVDVSGKVSPFTVGSIKVSEGQRAVVLDRGALHSFDAIGALPKLAGVELAVVDALDKLDPARNELIGSRPKEYRQANHLWSAAGKPVRIFASRNEFTDFQILLSGLTASTNLKLTFEDASIHADFFRFRHVKTKNGMLPDPLVPLNEKINIPATDEAIDGQKAASFLAEVFVPRDTKPGLHTGTLMLNVGAESLAIKVELTVWNFTLPDVLSFIPEMNCYGLPDDQEMAYYRLAHAHRTNLNRLGYSWRGVPNDGCAPKWNGKTFDWQRYDKRFGPLLDGSAFKDLPRGAIPVESFYLPLNENWPMEVNQHFKGGYWADEAFDAEYEKGFTAACAAFAEHFKANRWNQTLFEFYLNNKVYNKADKWSKSSAPWVLDEPVNSQDFWALRYFGKLFHAGVDKARGDVQMAFRCDISYPQWQRDFLEGVLDINICGGAFRQYHRAVMDRKEHNHEITFNYGSSNNIEDSNTQPIGWCLDTWCLGGDGVLPWQTVGDENAWKNADPLSLFYPSLPGGNEPLPSIRLKAYRRGQQDVEYLTILAALPGNSRSAVAMAVRDALELSANVLKKNADDAGLVDYAHLDPVKLWDLRMRVGAMLDAAHPAPRRSLIERHVFPRDMSKLPSIGFINQ